MTDSKNLYNFDISIYLLSILQPLVIILVVPDLLFNNDYILNVNNWNLWFGAIAIIYIAFLYIILLYRDNQKFIIISTIFYLTIGCWILLKSADFNYALHKSIWGLLYLMVVVLQSLFWGFLIMKPNYFFHKIYYEMKGL